MVVYTKKKPHSKKQHSQSKKTDTKSLYLENPLCTFTPLNYKKLDKKKNIVSVSLFKMSTTGYKAFERYLQGLEKLVKYVKSRHKSFTVRLFIDQSIVQDEVLMERLFQLPMEMVLYSCPNFMIQDRFHYGLFGTLVRFFPLFDFPNNDANWVVIHDSDFTWKKMNVLFRLLDTLKSSLSSFYLLKLSYVHEWFGPFEFMYKNVLNGYTNAQDFVGLRRISPQVLLDYLKTVKTNPQNTVFSYYYGETFEKKDQQFMGTHHFLYGVDEYFMNNPFMKYVIDHKLPFINVNELDLFKRLYRYMKWKTMHFNPNLEPPPEVVLNQKNEKALGRLLDEVLYRSLSTDSKISSSETVLQKYILFEKQCQRDPNKIYQILYEICMEQQKQYAFLFPKSFADIFSKKEYLGVYSFVHVQYEFSTRKDIMLNKIPTDS